MEEDLLLQVVGFPIFAIVFGALVSVKLCECCVGASYVRISNAMNRSKDKYTHNYANNLWRSCEDNHITRDENSKQAKFDSIVRAASTFESRAVTATPGRAGVSQQRRRVLLSFIDEKVDESGLDVYPLTDQSSNIVLQNNDVVTRLHNAGTKGVVTHLHVREDTTEFGDNGSGCVLKELLQGMADEQTVTLVLSWLNEAIMKTTVESETSKEEKETTGCLPVQSLCMVFGKREWRLHETDALLLVRCEPKLDSTAQGGEGRGKGDELAEGGEGRGGDDGTNNGGRELQQSAVDRGTGDLPRFDNHDADVGASKREGEENPLRPDGGCDSPPNKQAQEEGGEGGVVEGGEGGKNFLQLNGGSALRQLCEHESNNVISPPQCLRRPNAIVHTLFATFDIL